jgi:hypothetical protein
MKEYNCQDRDTDVSLEKHTPDWLRTFPGCDHYSDEEAIEIVNTLHSLAGMFYEVIMTGTPLARPVYLRKAKLPAGTDNLKAAA